MTTTTTPKIYANKVIKKYIYEDICIAFTIREKVNFEWDGDKSKEDFFKEVIKVIKNSNKTY